MFGLLKNKISSFINKIIKKEETISKQEEPKEAPKEIVEKEEPIEEKVIEPVEGKIEKKVELIEEIAPLKVEKEKLIEKKPLEKPKEKEHPKEEKIKEREALEEVKKESVKEEPKKIEQIEKKKIEHKKPESVKQIEKPKEKKVERKVEPVIVEKKTELIVHKEKKIEEKKIIEPPRIEEKKVEPIKEKPKPPEEKKIKLNLGITDHLKSFITGEVEIKGSDVSEMLEEFELELLEGDVALEVAEEIKTGLQEKLIGKKIKRGKISEEMNLAMEEVLYETIKQENAVDIVEFVKKSEKPVKIMFVGINGSGKTTTIGKIGKMLQNEGLTVVFAAADTFRAAAIEQIEIHGQRLGIHVIKRPYGSDSTAVAFDAVNHAKAKGIDAVLIDTAGRQDTNVDLLNEIKKMDRVIKPDLKIYIGESIGGNAVLSQVSSFHKEIGLTGVILTKVDCDPKGGVVLSISKSTGLPILYLTVGQKYEDIEKFDPEKIVKGLVG